MLAWSSSALGWGNKQQKQNSKDSTYYPPGKSNPNVYDKMYWHDSLDVLNDLDKFDKLYVVFHNCA